MFENPQNQNINPVHVRYYVAPNNNDPEICLPISEVIKFIKGSDFSNVDEKVRPILTYYQKILIRSFQNLDTQFKGQEILKELDV